MTSSLIALAVLIVLLSLLADLHHAARRAFRPATPRHGDLAGPEPRDRDRERLEADLRALE
jgi:hypothetical protein